MSSTRDTQSKISQLKDDAGGPGDEQPAIKEIGLILDRPPAIANDILRGDTRLTRRWSHGELHDRLPGLTSHVIMTYYGAEHDIALRRGSKTYASRTRPGTITLIPNGHEGRWDIAGPIEVSHVYITEERLNECAEALTEKSVELLDRVGFEDPVAARILEILSREASSEDPSSKLFLEQAVDLLCVQLVRGHSSHDALPDPQPRRGLANWQLKRVTEFMLSRLDQDVNLSELAGLVKLSRFHFATAFRLATGKSPYDWFVQQRIARARQLLVDPTLSVTDVGLIVGYSTPSAFTASFRKIIGATPTEFRRGL